MTQATRPQPTPSALMTAGSVDIHVVALEIATEQLYRGFMACLQNENACDNTDGTPCRQRDQCACHLELASWCKII